MRIKTEENKVEAKGVSHCQNTGHGGESSHLSNEWLKENPARSVFDWADVYASDWVITVNSD